ncbi:ABC transporter ATP-binding protein [Aeropyrum camini SY1 = JCM 12091]|uniref:ABC transporter ATP-binding protein n=2 Tax=Aeropyrum camini TaxID=229980 RepID=U3TD46_9CREN|nr:ABC transporter ATP-binding protein [Aeropyrum camini]BAN90351.1 ABC transporter ATP-binding protein [Aeropyrum camini SY1 = JCM 12091]
MTVRGEQMGVDDARKVLQRMFLGRKLLVETVGLKKYFPVKSLFFTRAFVKAVDNVTMGIPRGKTLGLVGESGSGKTTLGRVILRLEEPTGGKIFFDGTDVMSLRGRRLKEFRRRAQIIFQDPYGSLNPRKTIFNLIAEPIKVHGIKVGDLQEYIVSLLYQVGLNETHLYRYPHEFSGGQRQRIAIARVLALRPEFIVLDEPTSALDVSVQAQILNLLKDLQKRYSLTYLFISHDLGVVRYMSDYIAVMYLGKIVEFGEAEEVFEKPLHPYTRVLLESIPVPDPELARRRSRIRIRGEPPSPINPPSGCRFRTRCPLAVDKCLEEPPLEEVEKGHWVACWRPGEL